MPGRIAGKIFPELGELLCGFIVYTSVWGLTVLALIRLSLKTGSEQRGLSSMPANSFALHSQSARPIEIRRRFSFLLPPLFAPGRCAASLFEAVVMPLGSLSTAFVILGVAEPADV